MGDKQVLTPSLIEGLKAGKVVASDAGPTVAGVTAAKVPQFLYELATAVAEDQLDPAHFHTALAAAGVAGDVSNDLAHALWLVSARFEGKVEASDRLADLMKTCQERGRVPRRLLLETQELPLLQASGQVTATFGTREVRAYTKLTYQQTRYNLLREANEGYAKMVTLLNSAGGQPGGPGAASLGAFVSEARALIGFFSLDPNRVCDLVLEAWEAWLAANAKHATAPVDGWLAVLELFRADAPAQLLGFRFQYHQTPTAPPAPPALYRLAAQLVAARRVSLEALLVYLSPDDAELAARFASAAEAVSAEVATYGKVDLSGGSSEGAAGGAPRAGMFSGATLELDASRFDELLLDHLHRPSGGKGGPNQKLAMVEGLLAVGAWDAAWLLMQHLAQLGVPAAADRGVSSALAALVAARVDPLHDALFPEGPLGPSKLDAYLYAQEQRQRQPGGQADGDAGPPRPAPPLGRDAFDALEALGPYLYRDPALMTRVLRVLRYHVAAYCCHSAGRAAEAAAGDGDGGGDVGAAQVYRLLAQTVLPALAMVPANFAASNAVWAVLKLLPFPARFAIYRQANEVWGRTPVLQGAAAMSCDVFKRICRRLHNPTSQKEKREVLGPYRLAVAKIAAGTPLQIADAVVTYIATYDTQIDPVVAALKTMPRLAFDALVYAMLQRCGRYDRPKLKDDGNLAPTHSALAKFTGAICKRSAESLDLGALVQYIADSVKSGEALDLLLLNEMLAQMTGLVMHTEVSQDQIDVLSCGPVARAECMQAQSASKAEARGSDKQLLRGGRRLMMALQKGPPGHQLALPLLVLVAQQLDYSAIATPSKHLKLIADLTDDVLSTVLTYLEFLRVNMPRDDYCALLPPIKSLLEDYGVRLEVAMTAYRPVLVALEPEAPSSAAGRDAAAGAANGAAPEADAEMEEGEAEAPAPTAALVPAGGGAAVGPGGRSWAGVMADISSSLPNMGSYLTPELVAAFWGLTLPDIQFSASRYDALVERINRDVASQEAKVKEARAEADVARRQIDAMAARGGPPGAMQGGWGGHQGHGYMGGPGGRRGEEPRDFSAELVKHEEAARLARAEVARLKDALDKLAVERKACEARCAEVAARLERESPTWLPREQGNDSKRAKALHGVTDAMLQACILPRMTLSAGDAVFCFEFVKRLQALETPGWSAILFYDKAMGQLVDLIPCSTEREATCLGIFLTELHAMVERWRANKELYETECGSSHTFSTMGTKLTPHDRFNMLCHKWQAKTRKAFVDALESGEYVLVRNALRVLARMIKVFPVIKDAAVSLSKAVEPLCSESQREDIRMAARRYLADLEREKKEPGRMITVHAYGGRPGAGGPARRPAAAAAPGASRPGSPPGQAAAAKAAGPTKRQRIEAPPPRPPSGGKDAADKPQQQDGSGRESAPTGRGSGGGDGRPPRDGGAAGQKRRRQESGELGDGEQQQQQQQQRGGGGEGGAGGGDGRDASRERGRPPRDRHAAGAASPANAGGGSMPRGDTGMASPARLGSDGGASEKNIHRGDMRRDGRDKDRPRGGGGPGSSIGDRGADKERDKERGRGGEAGGGTGHGGRRSGDAANGGAAADSQQAGGDEAGKDRGGDKDRSKERERSSRRSKDKDKERERDKDKSSRDERKRKAGKSDKPDKERQSGGKDGDGGSRDEPDPKKRRTSDEPPAPEVDGGSRDGGGGRGGSGRRNR